MLSLLPTVKVFLAPEGVDMRKSFDGLTCLARDVIGQNPLSGHLFVFCNRRRNRVKVLFWDGTGLWVCAKRLEKGTFAWPDAPSEGASSVELSAGELALILGGFDLREATKRGNWWRPPSPPTEARVLEPEAAAV